MNQRQLATVGASLAARHARLNRARERMGPSRSRTLVLTLAATGVMTAVIIGLAMLAT